jgi:PAS domain S-box-containing protein
MLPIDSLLSNYMPGIDFPNQIFGWFFWLLVMLALLFIGLKRWWMPLNFNSRQWLIFIILFLVVPFTALFFGLQLPQEDLAPIPYINAEPNIPAIMVLSALPWVLAAGMLGLFPAVLLALFSGFFIALWQTHSIFTVVEIAGYALILGIFLRQNYRTIFYKILRHPVIAVLLAWVCFIPVFLCSAFFSINGSLAVRLDFSFNQTWPYMLARLGEFIIAGLAAELVYLGKSRLWYRPSEFVPSPGESSLQTRFLLGIVPLVVALVLALTLGDWLVAGNAARQMIRDRLSSTAQMASESLPYFLEAGQNLMASLAEKELTTLPPDQLQDALSQRMRSVPYFRQLFLFNEQGNPVMGYPLPTYDQIRPTLEEKAGIQLALRGVLYQTYPIPPWPGESSAQVSFIASIPDENGQVRGVLLGRTSLSLNPFTQPAVKALESVKELGGEGVIIDENHRILYHPIASQVMTDYTGRIPDQAEFFNEPSSTGARRLVYYQPVAGRPWAIVLTVPAELPQQLALNIAVPLLLILLLFSAIAIVFLRLILRGMTSSMHTLALEASLISHGQLDHALRVHGVDEIGQVGQAFEQMRVSLKARLGELNRLLFVSQGVAAHLEASNSIGPVLKAALSEDVSMARAVFISEVTLDQHSNKTISYGIGSAADLYAYLDEQIFELMQQQESLIISNTLRMRGLTFKPNSPHPGAIVALAVHRESRYYGALWVAYDHPRAFSDEEVRFLSTLAGQAALAASNASLYASAEIGRQRLEAVLASTPEPVLVIDEQLRLLLLNPAALQVSGLIRSTAPGIPIQEVINHPELMELIKSPLTEKLVSKEITLSNSRVYFASISSVVAQGQLVGKVCLLRDITHYKELDALKSDFVATVSHDLRSPLTLMRGYSTMLQMVGDLNEQQKSYIRKIVLGVENMSRMVNNLLDLGRIEAGIGLQIEKVNVYNVIDQVVTSLQPHATQKNIQLETQPLNQPVPTIEADAALLQQAVYNLVENAIKYTPVGGQIKVLLTMQASHVLFEVHDSGIGIAPLDLPHVFEKFYRSGRREAYQQRGTGLGLAIVKSITERHGGRVWVESQLGRGSTFYLEIPVRSA